MRREFLLLSASIFIIAAIGCSGKKLGPPEIIPDRTACSACKMLISDTRYAAAMSSRGGEDGEVFDDLGCMMSVIIKMKEAPGHIWVRDYEKNTWLDARSAIYVYAPKLGTPMSYGFVAVADTLSATALARAADGTVLNRWDEFYAFFNRKTK